MNSVSISRIRTAVLTVLETEPDTNTLSNGIDIKINARALTSSCSGLRKRNLPETKHNCCSHSGSSSSSPPVIDNSIIDSAPQDIALLEDNLNNSKARRQLWIVSAICLVFIIVELLGGIISNSLAIMTDAAHLLSDLAGFLISIFALWITNRSPTSRLSYGFHRAEIIGALLSVVLIWVLTGILLYEACTRIRSPELVDGKIMFLVACGGLLVNILMGIILHQGGHSHSHGIGSHSHSSHHHDISEPHNDLRTICDTVGGSSIPEKDADHTTVPGVPANINVSAAYIHVLGDALQSLGVMIAGGLIWYNPDYHVADPITTFFFSILVLFTTSRIVRQALAVLMEGCYYNHLSLLLIIQQ